MNETTTTELQQMITKLDLGFQEIRAMFQETDKKFQETDRKFQETDRQMKKSNQETWAMFQESERQMKKSNQETWAMFQESKIENDKMMKDLSDNLKKTESLFNSQWGKLVESLVEGDLIKLLEARGIEVKRTLERVKG